MGVTVEDIRFYKAKTMNDSDANGGKLGVVQIVNNLSENLFPHVTPEERNSGSTKYRKFFIKNENQDNEIAYDAKIWMEKQTPADDYVVIFEGTQIDTQADITANPPSRTYGCGKLTESISAGATEISVLCETNGIFYEGDKIRISDKQTLDDPNGKAEFHTIQSVSWDGLVATLSLNEPVENDYNANNTKVTGVIETDNINASVDNYNVTSEQGNYDYENHPVEIDNIGTIEEEWTITFQTSTTFECSGAEVGSVGSGSVNEDFTPENPNFPGRNYFKLKKDGWGGNWQSGDTFVFRTHPSAVPIWCKRVVPAGCSAFSQNTFVVAIEWATTG